VKDGVPQVGWRSKGGGRENSNLRGVSGNQSGWAGF